MAVRWLALIAVGSALGIGGSVVLITESRARDEPAAAKAEPEPRNGHETNRKVLTAAQTRRLVRYAGALHACLTRRGLDAYAPRKDSKAITIEVGERVGLKPLVSLTSSCAAPLGDPPKPASLQAVDARTIVLSVPKQCLLDPKVEA